MPKFDFFHLSACEELPQATFRIISPFPLFSTGKVLTPACCEQLRTLTREGASHGIASVPRSWLTHLNLKYFAFACSVDVEGVQVSQHLNHKDFILKCPILSANCQP